MRLLIEPRGMNKYNDYFNNPICEPTMQFRWNRTEIIGRDTSRIIQELEQRFIDSMGRTVWIAVPFENNF